MGGLVPPPSNPFNTVPPLPFTGQDFCDFRRHVPRMDHSGPVQPLHTSVATITVEDFAAGSLRSYSPGPLYVQNPTVDSPYSVSVGHISALDSIVESPSSSEKAAVSVGAPPGLASRPPVVSPSPTMSVSVPITARASSGLISSRTRHRSADTAETPRALVDYGFGRRTTVVTASSSPSTRRHRLLLGPGL